MTPDDTTLAYQLLQIVEKSAAHVGKLGNLQSWATDELMKMNAKLKDAAQEKAKADQAEAAKKAAADKAKADQEAAAQAPPNDPKAPPQRPVVPPGPMVDPNFGAPRAVPLGKPEVSSQAPRTAPAAELHSDTPDRRV
jgi:hypothetical protein